MFFMSAFAVLVVFRGVWVLSAPSIREDDYAAVRARTILESGLRCADDLTKSNVGADRSASAAAAATVAARPARVS